MFTYALHTYSRAYPGAPKPPQLGSGSGGTSQAAVVSRLDDQPPSGPRARAFPGLAAHRGMSMAGGASSTELPRNLLSMDLERHCPAAAWWRAGARAAHHGGASPSVCADARRGPRTRSGRRWVVEPDDHSRLAGPPGHTAEQGGLWSPWVSSRVGV